MSQTAVESADTPEPASAPSPVSALAPAPATVPEPASAPAPTTIPVTDVDLVRALAPILDGDPAEVYPRLRAKNGGVHQIALPNGSSLWLVTRYQDVKVFLADQRLALSKSYSRTGYRGFGLPPALDANLLNLDAPEHTRVRRLVNKAFTPRRADGMRTQIQSTIDALLAALPRDGSADLLKAIAAPLPIIVICDLLGMPAEAGALFREKANVLIESSTSGRDGAKEAMGQIAAFLAGLIKAKRAAPADDLLSAMIAARDGDDLLTEDELVSLAFLILLAGYENSVHLITRSLARVLDDPALAAIIRAQPNPDTQEMNQSVEELLRSEQPIVNVFRRFPVTDMEIGEHQVPAGDIVLLCIDAANNDPEVFTSPDRLDLARSDNPHLAFGHGPHYCLGAPLARLEVRLAIWTVIHRLPDLALATPADQLPWRQNYNQRRLTALPVTYSLPRV